MKNFVKKMKGKQVLSLVLVAIMLVTTFGIAIPQLKLNAKAVISIGGITQERVVGADGTYVSTYENYANNFLNGAGKATNIVIPGLKATNPSDGSVDYNDFVIQGLSYYPKKDWIMVSVYHNDGKVLPSMIFALDAKSGEFKHAFAIYNIGSTANNMSPNYDHGGGLAFSEYNFYYSGDDSDLEKNDEVAGDADQIAYAPLKYFDNPTDLNGDGFCDVILHGAVDLPEMNGAATAYVCYDEGILWAGNFYEDGVGGGNYAVPAVPADSANGIELQNSMIYGYNLQGESSDEEWKYLKGAFKNHLSVSNGSDSATGYQTKDHTGTVTGTGDFSWTATKSGEDVTIRGNVKVTSGNYLTEITPNFGKFNLTEGVEYKIEFTSTNINTDMYMFSPVGTHCNVKQSSQTKITQLSNGNYHYEMTFIPGLKPNGADSAWPTTQSTDGSYTGGYTIRFDQDYITSTEGRRDFTISGIRISETKEGSYSNNAGYASNPSHCVAVHTDYEDIQYAVVDNGKMYLSRSWGTGKNDDLMGNSIIQSVGKTPDYSTLTVGEIDLSAEGTTLIQYPVGDGTTVKRKAHLLAGEKVKHFDMMPMSEGLCFIDGDLYISFEGASNKYKNEYAWSTSAITNTGNCDYPIDVVWKVDPYALMEEEREEISNAVSFKRVSSLREINDDDEYIIVYESPELDPVTRKEVLYLFDAYGNFKDFKLSKSTNTSINGYDGMIGHPITQYSIEDDMLYLTNPEEDDLPSLRWNIVNANIAGKMKIQSPMPYYLSNRNFFFNADKISMTNDTGISDDPLTLEEVGDTGKFYLKNDNAYIWCNDFSVAGYESLANSWYRANGTTQIYAGISEVKGTFHTDALNTSSNIIGQSIDTTNNDYLRQVSIYKCVTDEFSSTEKNRVYTDMNAELQEDGTYTVNLETYATSALHYKATDIKKPTDFIFVLDASSSMATEDGTGMIEYIDGDLAPYSVAGEEKIASYEVWKTYNITDGNGAVGSSDIYIKIEDEYVLLNLQTSKVSSKKQYMWLYCTYQGRVWYWVPNTVDNPSDGGSWSTTKPAESATIVVEGNDTRARGNKVIYYGTHYRYTTNDYYNSNNKGGRYITMQESACNIIDKIVSDASVSGLNHRIAVTQFGGTTGFYANGSSSVSQGTDYSNAFWSTGSAATLKNTVNEISTSAQGSDGGEFTYADGIINANKATYAQIGSSGRSVAVIFISDGIAGADSSGGTLAGANAVLSQAKAVKEKGAFVYSVSIGHGSTSAYKKDIYMNAVSSQYPEASSINALGGECAEITRYYIDLSTAIARVFTTYVESLVRDIKSNDSVGVQKLEGNTVIIEQLSDAFIIPNNYDYDVELYKGYYDCLDRFQFVEKAETDTTQTAGIKSDLISNDYGKAIKVDGFNYSTRYIAKGHDGYKLKVTINGLLANSDANIINTSLNNTATTAVYQSYNSNNSSANSPFKFFPTEYFTIPEYTYVLDYGIQMLDTDVNGTLLAVNDAPAKLDVDAYKAKEPSTQKSDNGLVAITENSQDLLYSTTPNNFADSGYCFIKRDNGKYDWFSIKVVPASNVLFEEEYAPDKEGSTGAAWSKDGTTKTGTQKLTNSADIYGYDSVYEDSTNGHSYGSASKVTVTSENKQTKRSITKSFDFVGDGIDLISACGKDTGIMIVKISGEKLEKPKAYIVDTYHASENNLGDILYQTPIVSFRAEEHGTYTVEATATYLSTAKALQSKNVIGSTTLANGKLSGKTGVPVDAAEVKDVVADLGIDLGNADIELVWFDDNSILNGGTGAKVNVKTNRAGETTTSLDCYLDGFRIYNPMKTANENYIESEKNAQYINVIDSLKNNQIGTDTTSIDGIAYVSGAFTPDAETGAVPTLSFANYQSVGPQNELYLNGQSNAIVLKVQLPAPTSKVQLGLRAVTGTATVKVGSTQFPVNSATEMYYDVTNCVKVDSLGIATITIQNTGTGVLAVNNIKLTGDGTAIVLEESDLSDAALFMAAPAEEAEVINGVVTPIVEDDTTTPDSGDDTTGDDTTTGGSFIEQLIAMIMEIIRSIFTFLPVGEVM